MTQLLRLFFIASLTICSLTATDIKIPPKLPGDTSLPTIQAVLDRLKLFDQGDFKYGVMDYFETPNKSSFLLSPNGEYISHIQKGDEGRYSIYVKNLKTDQVYKPIKERWKPVIDYGWINNSKIYFITDKDGDENNHIHTVNLDGTEQKDITPYDGVRVLLIEKLKDDKDHVVVLMNKENQELFEPYLLNVNTGEAKILFQNNNPNSPINEYVFDKDGNLRAYKALEDKEVVLYYKDLETGKFDPIKTIGFDDVFSIGVFDYSSKDKNIAYVFSNIDSDKVKLLLYDLGKNRVVKEIFSNNTYDIDSVALSDEKRGYELDFIIYNDEKSKLVPKSDFSKKLHNKFTEKFGEDEFSIISADDAENRFVVKHTNDKTAGIIYLYTTEDDSFRELANLYPHLSVEDMAEMIPIKFKSRDGLTLHGYITLPQNTLDGEKVPLVVLPHGGPVGARDVWGYSPVAQLFASRGYATLQVNFRISGGYGKEFLRAGYKQIGRKTIDDLEDGVNYTIKKGWVDKDKIAIFGASYGGYAALMSLIKSPELYSCAVDLFGVANIETIFNEMPAYWRILRENFMKQWYDLENKEELEIARSVSPVFQADKIDKPLFVAQGANDARVNINESDQIVKAVRKEGFDVPYMVMYNEGHGLAYEENRINFFETMLGFLSKCFNNIKE
ncbi:MAG: prolyl oligopeptidase family serine peptidase [Campylobacterales bacterium]